MQLVADEDGLDCEFDPCDIDTTKPFRNAFGSPKADAAARWVVMACQKQESWSPFEPDLFKQVGLEPDKFRLDGLDTQNYVVVRGGKVHVTVEFIRICRSASPARNV